MAASRGSRRCSGCARSRATRVRLTLVAPDPEFAYRPMAVAEPFAAGMARRVPLADVAADAHAELVADALVGRRRQRP